MRAGASFNFPLLPYSYSLVVFLHKEIRRVMTRLPFRRNRARSKEANGRDRFVRPTHVSLVTINQPSD